MAHADLRKLPVPARRIAPGFDRRGSDGTTAPYDSGGIPLIPHGRAPFGQLSHLARTHLEAEQITWSTAEPRIEWSGKTPRLEAHLLLIGDFEP